MVAEPSEMLVPRGAVRAAAWFFANSPDMFLTIQGGVLKNANATWTQLTGWSDKDAYERPILDFVHPDDVEELREAFRTLPFGERVERDARLATKSGDWLWVRAQGVGGEDGWVLAIVRDITAERLRNAKRAEAQRATGMLSATAGVTIWRYNADLDEYEISPDFTGSANSDTAGQLQPGKTVRSRAHPEDAPALRDLWRHTLATGEPGFLTYRERREDESDCRHMRVAWQGAHQLPSGRWEIVGVAQDVTELVVTRDAALAGEQAALAAAEAKSQFLANISHEIRTPMNGVLGILHLIRAEPPKAERKRLVEEALASGVGLSDLLNDIIDYSDLETGHVELVREAVDPGEQLASVAALLKARAAKKGLALSVSCAREIGFVSADPQRLRKMFFHLIGNAVKFTHQGRVEVRLSASGDGDTRRLRLEVEDTGVGIPLPAQAGLFERFKQADGSSTRRFGGPGLGLAVTRRLAELMDGSVGFSSREGAGSTFWLEIGAPASAPGENDDDSTVAWLSGLRVLVVEDNATNRLVATQMLRILGADVHTAEDGAEGVAAVERSDFDVIFMDIQMPVMDGVEATKRIRAMPEPKCLVPIVATTANVMPEQLLTYRTCGINGVVAKPISPSALLAEVSRIANDEDEAACVATPAG